MRPGSGESTERATSWRMTERHSRSGRSLPTPKVGKPVVLPARDLVGALAEQDVDDVPGAEALAGTDHGREHLLRRHGGVPQLRRLEARVAVAARAGLLVEVREQQAPAAGGGLGVAEHGVELHRVDPLVLGTAVGLPDERPLLHDVGEAVRHPRDRRLAVAAGPTGLLVVALEALREVDVRDEAHVGLVDAHPEGDGGHDDDALVARKRCCAADRASLGSPAW